MKQFLLLPALLLGGCATTPTPCYNVENHDNAWQVGVVVDLGKAQVRRKTSEFTCPYAIEGDLLDPPFPYDDNMDWE